MRKPCKPRNSPSGSAECIPEHAQPSSPRTRECAGACGWGMKGTRFTPFRETTRPAEHVRVLPQGPLGEAARSRDPYPDARTRGAKLVASRR